jgi:riboflavin synthase
MFTGIITHIGTIERIEKKGDWIFTIATAAFFMKRLAIGASVCCSGVCLTVIRKNKNGFVVQVSEETLSCTTLGKWRKGTHINLERALKAGDELGGHFVSGHVDGVAMLEKKQKKADSWKLEFAVPKALSLFIAEKGSVTLDGVSLTVNEVESGRFCVNIIPHTLAATTLGSLRAGDAVNLEIDIIARYLNRLHDTH